MDQEKNAVLAIHDLNIKFKQYKQGLKQEELEVISGLSAEVYAGEILAVVGASGSGKSLLAHAVLGILPHNAVTGGTMTYCREALTPERQAQLRGKEIALIPQSVTYLDPLMKVGPQVRGIYGTPEAQRQVFQKYQLDLLTAEMYPFQLSGGMARRILVATAVIGDAKLIIADEPTPGLHPDIAEETLRHLRELADEGRAVLLITHELDLAFKIADRIAVFYAGMTIETAPAQDFVTGKDALRHPYSKALWAALPQNGFQAVAGSQPYAGHSHSGCAYAPRCSLQTEDCLQEIKMRELRGGTVRCCHAT